MQQLKRHSLGRDLDRGDAWECAHRELPGREIIAARCTIDLGAHCRQLPLQSHLRGALQTRLGRGCRVPTRSPWQRPCKASSCLAPGQFAYRSGRMGRNGAPTRSRTLSSYGLRRRPPRSQLRSSAVVSSKPLAHKFDGKWMWIDKNGRIEAQLTTARPEMAASPMEPRGAT